MFGDKWHRFIYGPDAINNVKALKETQSTDMNRKKITHSTHTKINIAINAVLQTNNHFIAIISCASWHLQLRMGGFCCSKVSCLHALAVCGWEML